MNPPLSVNSRCSTCNGVMLWGRLPDSGKSLPLDRCPVGRGEVRLLKDDTGLLIEFLSLEQRYEAYARQREAVARGEQPEVLYRAHSKECRLRAAEAKNTRRPRRRGRRGGRR